MCYAIETEVVLLNEWIKTSLKGTHSGLVKFLSGADIVQINSESASFFKYSTHYWTLVQSWGETRHTTRGMSRVQYAVLFFSAFTNHYYIQMNLITSGYIKKHFLPVVTPAFSLFLSHSVVFTQTCVGYSITVWIRAGPVFARNRWWLFQVEYHMGGVCYSQSSLHWHMCKPKSNMVPERCSHNHHELD